MKTNLTVCIVHYRKLEQLKKTVECLYENTSIPFELRIFNNGYEGDGIKEYLKALEKSSKYISVLFNKKNIGCSPGRKIITKNITTQYILMLDDDMYVNKNWDVPVWAAFKENKNLGAVGFSIFRDDGSFWWSGGRDITIKNEVVRDKRTNRDPSTTDQHFFEVDDVAAGAMVYRKDVEDLIPWDSNYFIGFEDLEKGLYLKKSDYSCLISIQSKFIHDKVSEIPEKRAYNNSRRDYHAYRRSYLYFIQKNKVRLDLPRHIFYKYVCLLPNTILQKVVFSWLQIKK